MDCPRCGASIRYKERSYNICPTCNKAFAFEPRNHPLKLTDKYFSKTIEKLSYDNKYFYTPQQLQIAVSRKKLSSKGMIIVYAILAIVTLIIGVVVHPVVMLVVILFWIIFILVHLLYYSKFVSLPQTSYEFDDSVINRWKSVYHHLPKNLIKEKPKTNYSNFKLRGILFCETQETENFFIANQLNIKFGCQVFTNLNSQVAENLPIYVLHDASPAGIEYLERAKQRFGNQRVIDLGLRPSSVMNAKFTPFRERNSAKTNFGSLSQAENEWLRKGFYVPLASLRPVQFIKYLEKQFERKGKQIVVESPEAKAKAIGFMTWAGEK